MSGEQRGGEEGQSREDWRRDEREEVRDADGERDWEERGGAGIEGLERRGRGKDADRRLRRGVSAGACRLSASAG
jgi:hypothetical protein